MDFSFILPSRGKISDIVKMLDSFERTTKNKDELEILFVFDHGTYNGIPEYINSLKYGFITKFYYQPHSTWWTRDYFNFLANRTAGDNICAFNDDAWMKTNHWDVKIKKAIQETGWSIYMVDIPDSARIKYQHTFPCFPMISRKGMNAVGFFFHEQVKVYPADKVLHEVYNKIERVIPIDNVLIQHDHILESDCSKSKLMEVFIEQRDKGELNIDITKDVVNLLRDCSKDSCKKKSKLSKILNIIKEK